MAFCSDKDAFRFNDAYGPNEALDIFLKYLDNKRSWSRTEEEEDKYYARTFKFINAETSVPMVLAEIFGCASIHHLQLVIFYLLPLCNFYLAL